MLKSSEKAALAQLDNGFRSTLRNVDRVNPKCMVLFSGAQGSGKTTAARAIEAAFAGLRIESDIVHALAAKLLPGASPFQRRDVARSYVEEVRDDLAQTAKNGMMILDCSIDRHADRIFEFADRHGYPSFVIAMDTPYDVNRERIISRGDRLFDTVGVQLDRLERGREEQERFLDAYRPDVTISPEQGIHTAISTIEGRLAHLVLEHVS